MKTAFLVIGHEPGGGARGERAWNIKVADSLKCKLKCLGIDSIIYEHRTKSYHKRCLEMRDCAKIHNPDCVLLMHYNSFSDSSANGHEFHYRSFPHFAKAIRDAWQERYPWSRPRQNNGILKNVSGRGSSMIRLAPAPACLTEPFFESNSKERSILIDDFHGVAEVYAKGIFNFLKDR